MDGPLGNFIFKRVALLLVGIIISIEQPSFTSAILVGAIVESVDGRREAVFADLRKVFAMLSVPNFDQWLRERLAIISADGAYTGGPDALHKAG